METSEYNYTATSKRIHGTDKSNLAILMSPKTYNTLKRGILPQIYNSGLFDIKDVFDEENIHLPYKAYNITDGKTPITLVSDPLISDTRIVIYDKRGINIKMKFEAEQSQAFVQNNTIQNTLITQGNFAFQP